MTRIQSGRRGFTAFEALIASAILAFLTASVSAALMAGRQQSRAARDMVAASMLAQTLMEEVMRLPTADPLGYKTMGPDPGETRSTFNSVKDYHGYTDGPNMLTDLAGNSYPSGYQGFIRSVTVAPATYTPTGWGRTISALQVTVSVTASDGRPLTSIQRIACN